MLKTEHDVSLLNTSLASKGKRDVNTGLVVLITGRPKSGKTALAKSIYNMIKAEYPSLDVWHLDEQNEPVRQVFPHYPSDVESSRRARLMSTFAAMLVNSGGVALCSLRGRNNRIRSNFRCNAEYLGAGVVEVYLDTSCDVALSRFEDGEFATLSPLLCQGYLEPKSPSLVLDGKNHLDYLSRVLFGYLDDNGWLITADYDVTRMASALESILDTIENLDVDPVATYALKRIASLALGRPSPPRPDGNLPVKRLGSYYEE